MKKIKLEQLIKIILSYRDFQRASNKKRGEELEKEYIKDIIEAVKTFK